MSKPSSQLDQSQQDIITAEEVRKVEFREKRRGYHPQDVDAFLERVARGIEKLQAREVSVSESSETSLASTKDTSQIQTLDSQDIPNDDGMLLKALVLAQRTADLALEEARQEASRIVSEAEAKVELMLTDAESEVSRNYLEGTQNLRKEVDRLNELKTSLEAQVQQLQDYVFEQKKILTDSVESTSNWLRENFLVLQEPPVLPNSMDSEQPVLDLEKESIGEEELDESVEVDTSEPVGQDHISVKE